MAAESERPDAALRGGQRKPGNRAHAFAVEMLHEFGKARVLSGVSDHEGLLRLPDPA